MRNIIIKREQKRKRDYMNFQEVPTTLTENEKNSLRNLLIEWESIKRAVNVISNGNEPVHSINELYNRIKNEVGVQMKVRKTINMNKGVGTALDDFANRYRVHKQDVIELALFDFFEKYGADYNDLRGRVNKNE